MHSCKANVRTHLHPSKTQSSFSSKILKLPVKVLYGNPPTNPRSAFAPTLVLEQCSVLWLFHHVITSLGYRIKAF